MEAETIAIALPATCTAELPLDDDISGLTQARHAYIGSLGMLAIASGGLIIAAVVAVALLFAPIVGGVMTTYQDESSRIGFCDAGSITNSVLEGLRERIQVASAGITEYADYDFTRNAEGVASVARMGTVHQDAFKFILSSFLPDECTPCPANATCTSSVVMCERGFTIAPHRAFSFVPGSAITIPSTSFSRREGLRLRGFFARAIYMSVSMVFDGRPGVGPIALPPQCVEDAKLAHRLHVVRETVNQLLSEECGLRACRVRGAMLHEEKTGGISEAQRWGIQIQMLKGELARQLPVSFHRNPETVTALIQSCSERLGVSRS